jgi:PTS system nitrogen regulatory IIA component
VYLEQLFHPERIVIDLKSQSRDGVLRELVERVLSQVEHDMPLYQKDAERILSVLEERERLGGTGLRHGLAIPHGKISGIDKLYAIMGLHFDGVDFHSLDHLKTHVIVVLFSPESRNTAHLAALARLAKTLMKSTIIDELLTSPSSESIMQLMKKYDFEREHQQNIARI